MTENNMTFKVSLTLLDFDNFNCSQFTSKLIGSLDFFDGSCLTRNVRTYFNSTIITNVSKSISSQLSLLLACTWFLLFESRWWNVRGCCRLSRRCCPQVRREVRRRNRRHSDSQSFRKGRSDVRPSLC